MKKLLIIILIFCAVLLIISCSIVPLNQKTLKHPHIKAVNGVLDLSGYDLEKKGAVRLDGEWEFYWNNLIEPDEFKSNINQIEQKRTGYLELPGIWSGLSSGGKRLPEYGAATLRLIIKLPAGYRNSLGLKIEDIQTAYRLWINGKLLAQVGIVSTNSASALPSSRDKKEVYFENDKDEIEIVLQNSDYEDWIGGIPYSINFGLTGQITKLKQDSACYDYFLIGSLLIFCFYHLGLYFLRRKEISNLYFGIYCIIMILYFGTKGSSIIYSILPDFGYFINKRIDILPLYFLVPFFYLFVRSLFKDEYSVLITRIIMAISALFILIELILPTKLSFYFLVPFDIFGLAVCFVIIFSLIRAIIHKREGSLIIIAGFMIIFVSAIVDFLSSFILINTNILMPLGALIFVFFQAFAISMRFTKALDSVEELSGNLSKKVEEKTYELSAANEKLQSLDRAKSRFFANVSHELRTPLTLILGPLEGIAAGQYNGSLDSNSETFRSVMSNARRLLTLISSLLDFSSIEAGRMNLKKRPVDIDPFLKRISASFKPAAEVKNIMFIYDGPGKSVCAEIDPGIFEKAVYNLLSNALKFTPEGGSIILRLEGPDNGHVRITVKDSGIGIAVDKQPLLFERFRQLDESSTRKYEGTGIGLALTKEIMAMHGGSVSVDSNEGAGAAFTLEITACLNGLIHEDNDEKLPEYHWKGLVNPVSSEEQYPVIPSGSDYRYKILIVEDNSDMRRFIREGLGQDYVYMEASDGEEGLERFREFNPDLVLSDVMMPRMDGYELAREIRKNNDWRGIPVILLTAKADPDMKIEGLDSGADDYIVKPFNVRELAARIKNHLEMKQLRDDAVEKKNIIEKAYIDLEKAETRFKETAELLPGAIIELDGEGRITYINRYGLDMLRIERDDIPAGPLFSDFVRETDKARWNDMVHRTIQSGFSCLTPFRLTGKNNNDEIVALVKISLSGSKNGTRIAAMDVKPFFGSMLRPEYNFFSAYSLTRRETDIISLVTEGFSNREIEERLFISNDTLRRHLKNAYVKMGITNEGREGLKKILQEYNRKRHGFGDFYKEFFGEN